MNLKHFSYISHILAIGSAFVLMSIVFTLPILATDGINKTINFQGKLVDDTGLNVADGTYDMVFKIYNGDGTTLQWTETRTSGSAVTVTNGKFQVQLGSVNAFGTNINWNTDDLYLGITVNNTGESTESEMSPRIRLTAVPQAFNAEKVNGLTVTNTSDNPFSSATALKLPDGNTYTIASPNSGTSDTIATLTSASTLTNKTIGSTGLTFSGASTDLTTVSGEDLTLTAADGGIISLNDTISLPTYAGNNAVLFANHTSGTIGVATTSTSGQCLISGASAGYQPSWGACSGAS